MKKIFKKILKGANNLFIHASFTATGIGVLLVWWAIIIFTFRSICDVSPFAYDYFGGYPEYPENLGAWAVGLLSVGIPTTLMIAENDWEIKQ